jgi:signal transduction histidine kinase
MKLLRTSTFQLTVLYAVMLAISMIVVSLFLYWSTIGFLQRQTDTTIDVEIAGLRESYSTQGLNGLTRVIGDRIKSGDDPDALYLFADRQLRPLAGNLEQWPELIETEAGWYSFHTDTQSSRPSARGRVIELPRGLLLLVGRDVSELDRLLRLSVGALAWGTGLVMALALLGGIFMSKRVQRRVESVNETTRRIVGGDLSQRIATRGTRDEFDQLAENLNRMLEQIETLMGGIRHVGDSIAHDLCTPLTRLRYALERTASASDIEDMQRGVEVAIGDADKLLATFSALLRIARIESGGYSVRRELLPLTELAGDALELYGVMAEDRGISVTTDLDADAAFQGDRDLVFQMIVNLLDNALKYTPDGGEVRVRVEAGKDTVRFAISDTGCGIPEEQLDKVTRRFYRVDASRRHPGSGLGLSLVRAVADHHDADLSLSNTEPGLLVQVSFPKNL